MAEVYHQRERQGGFSPGAVFAVGQLQTTAVGFSNLAAENQANAAAAVLGSKEWNKKILAVQKPRPFVEHKNFQRVGPESPAYGHLARVFFREVERGIHGITDQINQELLKLVCVSLNINPGTFHHAHRQTSLQGGCPANQRLYVDLGLSGRRHASELRVTLHEPTQGFNPVFNYLKAVAHILINLLGQGGPASE